MDMDEGVMFGLLIAAVFLGLFAVEAIRVHRGKKTKIKREQYASAATWGVFLILTCAGHVHKPNDPSILITCGATMELLAFLLLWIAPRRPEVSAGVARAPPDFAFLMVLLLALRLVVTSKWNGYLPVDRTGDGCIQVLQALSLAVSVYGLSLSSPTKRVREITVAVAVSMAAGYLCFGDLDRNTGADEAYAMSIYLEVAAWLMMARFVLGPHRADVNAAFLMPAAVQAFCNAYFWYAAHEETAVLRPVRLQRYFNTVLIICHVVIGLVNAGLSTLCIQEFNPSLPHDVMADMKWEV